MRTLALLLTGVLFSACGAATEPSLTDGGVPPDAGAPGHELTFPAEYAASHALTLYARLDGGEATDVTDLSYSLGDGYPTRATLSAESGYVLTPDCEQRPGPVIWRSIVEVQGSAAKLELVEGTLSVDLREEGDMSAIIEGEITGQRCASVGESIETSIPLKHRVVLHVRRVAGFVVEQFQQQLADCWDSLILPSGAPLWIPKASPLDAAGQRFQAANAPKPVAITLRSLGRLALSGDRELWAEPGTVSISVETKLPVQGLRSFEVVGPDALSSLSAALYLHKAVAKGHDSERIEDGRTYTLFFPEQSNTVDLRIDSAMTARGKLCASVPRAWISSTTSTPEQCLANAGDAESFFDVVADILAPGECRLEVTIPGTTHRWTAAFSTTN